MLKRRRKGKEESGPAGSRTRVREKFRCRRYERSGFVLRRLLETGFESSSGAKQLPPSSPPPASGTTCGPRRRRHRRESDPCGYASYPLPGRSWGLTSTLGRLSDQSGTERVVVRVSELPVFYEASGDLGSLLHRHFPTSKPFRAHGVAECHSRLWTPWFIHSRTGQL